MGIGSLTEAEPCAMAGQVLLHLGPGLTPGLDSGADPAPKRQDKGPVREPPWRPSRLRAANTEDPSTTDAVWIHPVHSAARKHLTST